MHYLLDKMQIEIQPQKRHSSSSFFLFQGCLTLNILSIFIHFGMYGFILVARQSPVLQANQLNVSRAQWHDRSVFLNVSNNTALINRNMGLRSIMQPCLQTVHNKEETSSPSDISTMRQALSCKHKLYPKMVPTEHTTIRVQYMIIITVLIHQEMVGYILPDEVSDSDLFSVFCRFVLQ